MFLSDSPMCPAFSAWQRTHDKARDPDVVRKEYAKVSIHIKFTMDFCKIQHAAGSFFCMSTLPRQPRGQNRLFRTPQGLKERALLSEMSANPVSRHRKGRFIHKFRL